VLIKIGLDDIPALTFAGLRYGLAALCLLPFVMRGRRAASSLRALDRRGWLRLVVLGLMYYTVTQGAQFVALDYLPSLTVSLLLTFSVVAVALMGVFLLGERLSALQWGGMALSLVGAVVYFYPVEIPAAEMIGFAAATAGMLANAGSSILGRSVNRDDDADPVAVTVVSMGLGAAVLLVAGLATQGMPQMSLTSWLIVVWLAVVNTAFAFTLWNHTLRTLHAVESSIINNTMLIQIAVLAWLFLDEALTTKAIIGMALAGVGALVVQLRRSPE
jgi:drug/metabolite transporter (DMT)-like permease